MTSLCSLVCSGTPSADMAGLKLKDLPASASQALGLEACATTAWLEVICFVYEFLRL